jgi:hypothetical protein
MSADRSEIPGLDSSELKELKEKLITAWLRPHQRAGSRRRRIYHDLERQPGLRQS